MSIPYLDGHCSSHGRADQYHALCPGTYRSEMGVDHYCACPNHGHEMGAESFANTPISRDNRRAKSDPALRQQPGSWPNSQGESDMTKRTRSKAPKGTPGVNR